jgi:hypothetical protein
MSSTAASSEPGAGCCTALISFCLLILTLDSGVSLAMSPSGSSASSAFVLEDGMALRAERDRKQTERPNAGTGTWEKLQESGMIAVLVAQVSSASGAHVCMQALQ